MRGGFLFALDSDLYKRVAEAIVEIGGAAVVEDDGGMVVQFTDDGERIFTLFERLPRGSEWEVHDGPFVTASGVSLPDMKRVTACAFECRWPDMVAWFAKVAAQTADAPTWLLDGDGRVWNANHVDPGQVRL